MATMTPLELLILVVAITVAAAAWSRLNRQQQTRLLRERARQWGMNFVAFDRFRLIERVRECFPVPGAADVRVTDVIYGLEGEHYRYLFTVQYTLGVVRTKHRRRRVMGILEPRAGDTPHPAAVHLATESADVLEQYVEVARAMQIGAAETS